MYNIWLAENSIRREKKEARNDVESKVGTETQIQKVFVRIAGACFAIVGEHVLVKGTIHANANDRIAIFAKRTYARKFTGYLKSTHRISSVEQIATVEAQIGQLELTIELLVGQIVNVNRSFVTARTQVASISAKVNSFKTNTNFLNVCFQFLKF